MFYTIFSVIIIIVASMCFVTSLDLPTSKSAKFLNTINFCFPYISVFFSLYYEKYFLAIALFLYISLRAWREMMEAGTLLKRAEEAEKDAAYFKDKYYQERSRNNERT